MRAARVYAGRPRRRRPHRTMVLLAEVVTAEEAAAGEIDGEKLSAMAAAFGQFSRMSADSPSLIPCGMENVPRSLELTTE